MNHVVIIGFMGSGKTRVGKQLSKDLGAAICRSGENYHKEDESFCKREI